MNFKHNEKEEKEIDEQNNNENNEEQEENSINVYDDNAYMLGEEDSEHNSINNNINEQNNENNDIPNQFDEKKENMEKQNEIQGLDEPENEENQENTNLMKKDEQKIDFQNKLNNKIKSDQNNFNDIQMTNQKDNIAEENDIENMAEEGEEQDEEGDEENLPLVTLKYISVCQCCKNPFDSKKHLPYLFKCGHFFCKECIEEQFTDEEGVKCPIDGLIAKTFKEFKLLNNLIADKTINSQRSNINNNTNSKSNLNNTCRFHKGQKLTHIVENTKEIVCVYCAFDLVRKNPNCEVRELKEQYEEYRNKADKIININQNNVEIIQKSLKDIKDNKNNEEKKVNFYFEHILKYINTKKEEFLSKIDSIFTANATKLSQKLENFSNQIELGENLKGLIDEYNKNNTYGYNEIYEIYLKLESLNEAEKNNKISLQEYKFIHEDETKMIKYINNFGDIKSIYKYIPFQNDSKDFYDFNNIIDYNKCDCMNKDNSFTLKRNMNDNNTYYLNHQMPNITKNKSFVMTNNKNNLNLLEDDIGNNSNYNCISTLNNNINNSKFILRINSNPKKYIDCSNFQRINNSNNNIQINKNIINDNNINYMKYNLSHEKGKSFKNFDFNNDNYKYNTQLLKTSKSIGSNKIYKENKKNKLDSFHGITSPGKYHYDFKRINK